MKSSSQIQSLLATLKNLKEKIKAEKNSNPEDLLREGYKERRLENELLTKDLFSYRFRKLE